MISQRLLVVLILGLLFVSTTTAHWRRPPRVGLLFALSFEAAPFISQLGLEAVNRTNGVLNNPLLPTRVYEGVHNNIHYKAVYAGLDRFSAPNRVQNIGPENAILSTLVLLNQFKADLIVSAGIAGGFSADFHNGDIGVCANNETVPYADRRTNFGLPGYGAFGIGEYKCADIPSSLLAANNLKLARVATSSSYDPSPTDRVFLEGTNVDIVEMEAAAEAYIAQVLNIPFLAFKVVSNSYAYPNDPFQKGQIKKQFESANWQEQKLQWPKIGRHILAQYDDDSIIVYQAYNPKIAQYAVEHKKFIGAPGFSNTRMTWIKTNFLWMMYRAGWAQKSNQERILAIWLSRAGFETILQRAAVVNRDFGYYKNAKDAKRALSKTSVRLQWDPDHTPSGTKLERRAIQLGLRNVPEYISGQWIVDIQDITPFVKHQFQLFKSKSFDTFETAKETIFIPSTEELCKHIALSKVGVPDNDEKMTLKDDDDETSSSDGSAHHSDE